MDLSNPIHSIIPSVHGDVLGVLGRTDRPLSGRAIADLLEGRAGVTGVSLVLRALVSEGIVLSEEHPPAILYRLNKEHLAAESIVSLAHLRERLIELLREQVGSWPSSPNGAWLFGSFARGTADSSSDIDVLVVRPNDVAVANSGWRQHLASFSRQVSASTGNDCRIAEFSDEEFVQIFENDDRLAGELRRDGIALTRRRLPVVRRQKVTDR
jgi:hypothetical protein